MIELRIFTPEELLQFNNSRVILTPKEKFDLALEKARERSNRFRKYHFKAIVQGSQIFVFDGLGHDIGTYNFTVIGGREARTKCLALFLEVPAYQSNGGFKFDIIGGPSLENMSIEEAENARKSVEANMKYHPIKICKECSFDFDADEFSEHSCLVGANWVIFGSFKKRFRVKRGN